ncbi:hypothetical protein D3C76_1282410 [compost metagenome]
MGNSWRGEHREIQHETIGRQAGDSGAFSVLVFQKQTKPVPAAGQPGVQNHSGGVPLRGGLEGAADRAGNNGTERTRPVSLLHAAHDDDSAP